MELLSALAGWKLPSVATAASLPARADESTKGLDRLRDEVVPVLTDAVKYLDAALDKSEHRFVCLGYGITWWCSHERDAGDRLCRLGPPQAASHLARMSSDLLGDICAILEVTARKGRSLFKRERRARRRPAIPAGNSSIRKARAQAREKTRKLQSELELVRRALTPTGTHITTGAAADGKSNGTTRKKRGRPKGTTQNDRQFDRRCWSAWQTHKYSTYAECANALGETNAP